MSSERKSYLIGKSIKSYLLASILASFAITLGVVVDGIIVGNLIGDTALVAVNLCVPLIQFMTAVTMLINVGGAIMVATSYGKMDVKSGNIFFTMAMIVTTILGILLLILGIFLCDEIVMVLCKDPSLRPLVKEYAQVVLLSAPLYLLVPGFSMFIRTDSNPKLASTVLIAANVCNLVMDLILIKIFNLGVMGSALATSLGYVLGFFIALTHFKRKNCSLSFKLKFEIKKLGKIAITGLPVALASCLMTVRFLFVNRIIMTSLGSQGMSIMAVCFNIMMLSSMFIGGTSQALQPVGGVLFGGKDYEGLKIAVKTSFKVLVTCISFIFVILIVFPNKCAELFGVSGIENITVAIRIFALSIPIFAANYLMMVNYQIIRIKALSIFISCGQALMVVPVMFIFSKIDNHLVWYSFLIGELIVLLITGVFAENYRKKDASLGFFFLLPKKLDNMHSFSISYEDMDIEKSKDEIYEFMNKYSVSKDIFQNSVKALKLYLSKLETQKTSKENKKYIDVIIQVLEQKILLVIKDDGPIFKQDQIEKFKNVDNNIYQSFDYSLIAGQNVARVSVER